MHIAKKTIAHKLPVNIAFFVYGYAKLRMLQFYYDFIRRVIPVGRLELLEIDTDSLYFSLSHKSLEESIAEDCKHLYDALKKDYLVLYPEDNRTPGLFKLEWKGTGMCLNSKTYVAFTMQKSSTGRNEMTNIKMSTKGVGKAMSNLSVL